MKLLITLSILLTVVWSKPTFLLDSLVVHKVAKELGLGNIVSVDADARAKLGKNEIGIDAAGAIGGDVVGYHAGADANVLGQKAKINANIYDGDKVDARVHQVKTDADGRQYVLVRQYVGTNSLLVRKYLDNGQIYVEKNDKPAEKVVAVRRPDGVVEIRHPGGIIELRYPNGIIEIRYSTGVIEIRYTDGIVEIRRTSGIIEFYYPDRVVEVRYPDGVVEIRRPGQRVEIRRPEVHVNVDKPRFRVVRV